MTRRIEIQHLPPSRLTPNPWNSNRVGPEMEQRLRASITEFGLYKPILVRELSDSGALQILGGEHRWQIATDMGLTTVPVVNLGEIDDKKAKLLGLADNGQYGEDDASMLSRILKDIGEEDVAMFLPYSDQDLAGMFAAADIDLDSLGFDDDEARVPLTPEADTRAKITHELMRLKVPVEDRERVQGFFDHIVNTRGLKAEEDSMVAAGMALVLIVNAAREVM